MKRYTRPRLAAGREVYIPYARAHLRGFGLCTVVKDYYPGYAVTVLWREKGWERVVQADETFVWGFSGLVPLY